MLKLILLLTVPLFILDLVSKQWIVWNFLDPVSPFETTVSTNDGHFAKEYAVTFSDVQNPLTVDGTVVDAHHLKSIRVINDFFSIVRVHNTGVAFGMGNGAEWANYVFKGITIAALALIWWLCRNNAFPTRVSRVAVALLLSGVCGNLLDRFMRGYVVDFLHFYWGERQWPSFNVADACICIAAGLLFISAFQKAPVKAPAEQKA